MGGAWIVGPAVFLDGSICRRVGLLARDLLVFAGILKLQLVQQKIAGHLSRRLTEDCKARKIRCLVLRQKIEGQERLLVANVSLTENESLLAFTKDMGLTS